ncbi:hypothetical protein IV203_020888 [Nitzschia inconspicua]|uniref:Uncharacterized protein n=1 Tax=Nitzschia inconspicua TaxID=303405 RepID=A0A9K3PCX1_9STRA|nr:hypothetical protein IV203_020888 [Nitzschia inconspicua]
MNQPPGVPWGGGWPAGSGAPPLPPPPPPRSSGQRSSQIQQHQISNLNNMAGGRSPNTTTATSFHQQQARYLGAPPPPPPPPPRQSAYNIGSQIPEYQSQLCWQTNGQSPSMLLQNTAVQTTLRPPPPPPPPSHLVHPAQSLANQRFDAVFMSAERAPEGGVVPQPHLRMSIKPSRPPPPPPPPPPDPRSRTTTSPVHLQNFQSSADFAGIASSLSKHPPPPPLAPRCGGIATPPLVPMPSSQTEIVPQQARKKRNRKKKKAQQEMAATTATLTATQETVTTAAAAKNESNGNTIPTNSSGATLPTQQPCNDNSSKTTLMDDIFADAEEEADSQPPPKKKRKKRSKAQRRMQKAALELAETETAEQKSQVGSLQDYVVASSELAQTVSVEDRAIVSGSTSTNDNPIQNDVEQPRIRLAEDKIERLQMEMELQKEKTELHASSEDVASSAASTNSSTGPGSNTSSLSVTALLRKGSRAQEAREKLEAARSKLRGALKDRERALRQSTFTKKIPLPPVSALSSPLFISNIATSGHKDKVYRTESSRDDTGRARLEEFLGKDTIRALHSHKMLPIENGDETSLAARKLRLQQELVALKMKLEKSQNKALLSMDPDRNGEMDTEASEEDEDAKEFAKEDQGTEIVASKRAEGLTKEALERRKAEAQATMDISYWKHFVSKQEGILEKVMKQGSENDEALEKCQMERHEVNKKLLQTQEEIDHIDSRKRIVEDGISATMAALLNARQALYEARKQQETTSVVSK